MKLFKFIFGRRSGKDIKSQRTFDLAIDAAIESYKLQRQLIEDGPVNSQPQPIVWNTIHPLISHYILYYAIARLRHFDINLSDKQRAELAISINQRLSDSHFDLLHFYLNPDRLTQTGKLLGHIEGKLGYKKLLLVYLRYVTMKSEDKGSEFCNELIEDGYDLSIAPLDKIIRLIDASFVEIDNVLYNDFADSVLRNLLTKL